MNQLMVTIYDQNTCTCYLKAHIYFIFLFYRFFQMVTHLAIQFCIAMVFSNPPLKTWTARKHLYAPFL